MRECFLTIDGDSGCVLSRTTRGCRSFLSDYYLQDGTNLRHGRGNIGVVTLHLPMIYAKAKSENKKFFTVLKQYLDMIRDIHKRTYDLTGKQVAGSNPLMFCEGGFYGGHLKADEQIAPIVKKYFTASFGVTALNELSILATGKSLRESQVFANLVIDFIQGTIDEYKREDGYAYSIYGTPAESLSGLQVKQFRSKYGIVKGVSDREYVSNSFHLHVSEDITPIEKQDKEVILFDKCSGGHIQYVRINNPENIEAIYDIVKRGVLKYGLYQGVNLNACTCHNCGHQWSGKHGESCPECGSDDIVEFNRICGYLGMSRKNGDHTLNSSKMSEVKDRVSM